MRIYDVKAEAIKKAFGKNLNCAKPHAALFSSTTDRFNRVGFDSISLLASAKQILAIFCQFKKKMVVIVMEQFLLDLKNKNLQR